MKLDTGNLTSRSEDPQSGNLGVPAKSAGDRPARAGGSGLGAEPPTVHRPSATGHAALLASCDPCPDCRERHNGWFGLTILASEPVPVLPTRHQVACNACGHAGSFASETEVAVSRWNMVARQAAAGRAAVALIEEMRHADRS